MARRCRVLCRSAPAWRGPDVVDVAGRAPGPGAVGEEVPERVAVDGLARVLQKIETISPWRAYRMIRPPRFGRAAQGQPAAGGDPALGSGALSLACRRRACSRFSRPSPPLFHSRPSLPPVLHWRPRCRRHGPLRPRGRGPPRRARPCCRRRGLRRSGVRGPLGHEGSSGKRANLTNRHIRRRDRRAQVTLRHRRACPAPARSGGASRGRVSVATAPPSGALRELQARAQHLGLAQRDRQPEPVPPRAALGAEALRPVRDEVVRDSPPRGPAR